MCRIYGMKLSGGLAVLACLLTPALSWASQDPLSEGLWWLYHGRYRDAEKLFDKYCEAHPDDPAGYFYKTANNWWELAQKLDYKLPEIEQQFEDNYQKTIAVAEKMSVSAVDNKTKAKALLYWGGAEGLKGRLLVTQQ